MQRLEVSGAVRRLYGSLGVKGLTLPEQCAVVGSPEQGKMLLFP